MLQSSFSSKLHWGCYIISIAKTASQKIGFLILCMKFLSLQIIFISINLLQGLACNISVIYGLVHVAVTQTFRQVSYKSRYEGCFLEPFVLHRNVARLSLSCGYYFGGCSSELVPFPYSRERSTRYSDRLQYCYT